jgi:GNAT superfamily N-acetyltransferase
MSVKVLWDIENGVPGVRLANKADEGQLFGLLSLLHAENALFSMNKDKVLVGIRYATERQGGIIFVIDEGPVIVASLGMVITSDWYSDDEYLLERWNFVHPEYRRSEYARMLLETGKWAHEWFKAKGKLMPFMCGINSYKRTEAKIRMYGRLIPCIGAYFMYGQAPRQQEEVAQAMAHLEELRIIKGNRERISRAVPSTVETLIRVSQRNEETADVR